MDKFGSPASTYGFAHYVGTHPGRSCRRWHLIIMTLNSGDGHLCVLPVRRAGGLGQGVVVVVHGVSFRQGATGAG